MRNKKLWKQLIIATSLSVVVDLINYQNTDLLACL